MTLAAPTTSSQPAVLVDRPDRLWRRALSNPRILIGGAILLAILAACLLTLPLTMRSNTPLYYDQQNLTAVRRPPSIAAGLAGLFGTDILGRSLLSRCLIGGTISLAIGAAAAMISLVLGVGVGLVAGYRGGWVDSFLMRAVDVLYGLPEILMIILLQFALRDRVPNVVVLFLAIGLVSWLTMARVVRGQVLSLRGLPFIEAARAAGLPESRIFLRHIFPNLAGPIIVYATLTVPRAILEESLLSFLGIGIAPPLATWGSLASTALQPALSPVNPGWWLLLFPCTLLAVTLLSLNFLGDGLRDLFDPKETASNV
jgi:oligopeptide transport system permease protein